jgi:DNA recombination protein RmuC
MDQGTIYILGGIIIVGFAFVVVFLNKKFSDLTAGKDDSSSFLMLNQNIQGMQERIDKTTEAINTRLDKAAEVIGDVQKELGGVQEIGHSMKELQDFLRSPKIRGNVGEAVLKDLLEQMIPKANLSMQYRFKSGEAVDAIIKTKNGLIPIDSKFPMENFQKASKCKTEEEKKVCLKEFYKDVKKHVDAIAKKYILPSEGTVDFAVMYMPSEGIYYETINNIELYKYAGDKKILFVSPNSFYYFLKIIMQALGNEKIEEKAKEVLNSLRGIQQDSRKFGDDLSVLNKHVTNAKNSMDSVNSNYARLGAKIENTGQLQASTVKELEEQSPEIEEK